jgi:hypothetical protein
MTQITTIDSLASDLDRVALANGTVFDVHRQSLPLACGQHVRVEVAQSGDPIEAPYMVNATVYDRHGDSVYASAGGLLHRLPNVPARIGDLLVIGVTPTDA